MVLQRIIRFLKDKKGISTSLVEAGAVISIGVALAAAFAPSAVKQATKGEDTRALSDVSSIKQMATSFQADTGKFMAYHDTADILISGSNASGLLEPSCPSIVTTTLHFGEGTTATCGNINDYLFDPKDIASQEYEDYNTPYGPEMPVDPWGNPYLVYINPFRVCPSGGCAEDYATGGTVVDGEGWGWIISAGENGVLETDVTHGAAQGDDIGLVMEFRNKP